MIRDKISTIGEKPLTNDFARNKIVKIRELGISNKLQKGVDGYG